MRHWLVYGLTGLVIGIIPGYWLWLRAEPVVDRAESDKVLAAQEPAPLPESVTNLEKLNILLLGQGGPGHEGGELTDAIILAQINFSAAKIVFISIPRDLLIEGQKINRLFAADYALLQDAVATVTHESVNYYVAVDFVGFQRALGYVLEGIEVAVGENFDDHWYPIEGKQLEPCGYTPEEIAELTAKYTDFELQKRFPCRYERVSFKAGKTFMNGAEALKYVRSRHSTSDFDRGRRQQEVLVGIKNKLVSLGAVDDVARFFGELTKYVRTDINLGIAQYLAPALKNVQGYKTITANLSTENVLRESRTSNGAFGLVPKNNWDDVRSWVTSH